MMDQQRISKFWCHHCRVQFTSHLKAGSDDILCPACQSQFCQIFTSHSQPSNFEPYQKPLKPKHRRLTRYTTHAVLLALAQYADDLSAQKVRQISEEDTKKLKIRVDCTLQQCLICKQDMKYGTQALKCPCLHVYHVQCLSEWLEYRNSCPKCRSKILLNVEQ